MAGPQREASNVLRLGIFRTEIITGQPGDSHGVAGAILHLISDDSARATGAEPTADGRRGAD